MTVYDEALRLFEELDGLDDAFIEEGIIPDEPAAPRPGRGLTVFFRRMGSGEWAAVIGGILAVGALYALIRWGALDSSLKSEDASPPADLAPMGTMQEEIKPDHDLTPEEKPLPDETESDRGEEGAEGR